MINMNWGNWTLYEDYFKESWASSKINNVSDYIKAKLGPKIDYDLLLENEACTSEERMNLAKSLCYTTNPWNDEGICKFIKHCIKEGDHDSIELMLEYFSIYDLDMTGQLDDQVSKFLDDLPETK